MMKKLTALLLALVLVLSLVPMTSAADTSRILAPVTLEGQKLAKGRGVQIPIYVQTSGEDCSVTAQIRQGDQDGTVVYETTFTGPFRKEFQECNLSWRNAPSAASGTYVLVICLQDEAEQVVDEAYVSFELVDSAVYGTPDLYLYDCSSGSRRTRIYVAKGSGVLTNYALGAEGLGTWFHAFDPYTCDVDGYLDGTGSAKANEKGVYCRAYPDRLYVVAPTCGTYVVQLSPLEDFPVNAIMEVCTDSRGHVLRPASERAEGACGKVICTKCGWETPAAAPAEHAWALSSVSVEDGSRVLHYVCMNCLETKTNGNPTPRPHQCPVEYTDHVPQDHWAHNDIDYVTELGLMSGVGGGRFAPDQVFTRAQAVSILYRISGSVPAAEHAPFTDLTQGWYKDAVDWAYANGVVSGTTATTFSPDQPITREMLAVFLYKYYTVYKHNYADHMADLSQYPDAGSVHTWAQDAMSWAVGSGFLSGAEVSGQVYLQPRGACNRAVAAALFSRCWVTLAY